MADQQEVKDLAKAWQGFIAFCKELNFGEIESLKIKDGVPVHAEIVRRSVKLS